MAYKNKKDRVAASRKHYLANKDRVKARAKAWTVKARLRNQAWLSQYLLGHPCVDCGNADIRVLDFDHTRGIKAKCVSKMAHDCHPLSAVIEEVSKCDVRCANCHRIRHFGKAKSRVIAC